MLEIRIIARWVAAGLAVALAVAVLGIASMLGAGWLLHGRHKAAVTVAAFAAGSPRPAGFESLGAGEGCPDSRPVKIAVRNDSARTLTRARVMIEAHWPGHSANLLPLSAGVDSDSILQPGQEVEGCYSFAAAPYGVIYSARLGEVSFR